MESKRLNFQRLKTLQSFEKGYFKNRLFAIDKVCKNIKRQLPVNR